MNESSDTPESLNWSSLGRLVRRGTLEAVAMHFWILGADAETDKPPGALTDVLHIGGAE